MVNATATTTITNAYSQVSSTLVTVESTTAAAEGLPSQTIEWVAVVLILVALGVIFLFSKKRPAKVG